MAAASRRVQLGSVSGVFGVRGWIKVYSFTRPPENILGYGPWQLVTADGRCRTCTLEAGRRQGRGIVAKLTGVDDADAAQQLAGARIEVARERLGAAEPGRFFWADLEGLRVVNLAGAELGRVDSLIETGANDVLVVCGERRRLIPFVMERVVKSVDLDSATVIVDWDPDF